MNLRVCAGGRVRGGTAPPAMKDSVLVRAPDILWPARSQWHGSILNNIFDTSCSTCACEKLLLPCSKGWAVQAVAAARVTQELCHWALVLNIKRQLCAPGSATVGEPIPLFPLSFLIKETLWHRVPQKKGKNSLLCALGFLLAAGKLSWGAVMKGEASRNRDLGLPKASGRSILIIKDFFNWNILLPNPSDASCGWGRPAHGGIRTLAADERETARCTWGWQRGQAGGTVVTLCGPDVPESLWERWERPQWSSPGIPVPQWLLCNFSGATEESSSCRDPG